MKNICNLILFLLAVALGLAFTACTDPVAPEAPAIKVVAAVEKEDDGFFANIVITDDGTSVTDATVSVNSTSVPYSQAESKYRVQLTGISEGDTLSLSVASGDIQVQGSVIMPVQPLFTVDNASCSYLDIDPPTALNTADYSWTTLSPLPDRLIFFFEGAHTETGSDYIADVAVDATAHAITSLDVADEAADFNIYMKTINNTALTGASLEADSSFSAVNSHYILMYWEL